MVPAIQDARQLLDPAALLGYRAPGTRPVLPAPLSDLAYLTPVVALVAWLAVVAAGTAVLARRGLVRRSWLVPAIALVVDLPYAVIVWNGDAEEIPRHALLVGVLGRLSLILLTAFVLEAALGWWKSTSTDEAQPMT